MKRLGDERIDGATGNSSDDRETASLTIETVQQAPTQWVAIGRIRRRTTAPASQLTMVVGIGRSEPDAVADIEDRLAERAATWSSTSISADSPDTVT